MDDDAFKAACECGHLQIAQWLFALGGVVMHAGRVRTFGWVCQNGHLQVAQWLTTLSGWNIHADEDYAFELACWCGHLGLARWLVSLDPSWNWPTEAMWALQVWSEPRDAWMRAVSTCREIA
jgi:hypothetical protein